jgi:hypothetical protein
MFFVALTYAIVSNVIMYRDYKKLNEDWYKLAINQNDDWAKLCGKIEAERDVLRERIAELKAERSEE